MRDARATLERDLPRWLMNRVAGHFHISAGVIAARRGR